MTTPISSFEVSFGDNARAIIRRDGEPEEVRDLRYYLGDASVLKQAALSVTSSEVGRAAKDRIEAERLTVSTQMPDGEEKRARLRALGTREALAKEKIRTRALLEGKARRGIAERSLKAFTDNLYAVVTKAAGG